MKYKEAIEDYTFVIDNSSDFQELVDTYLYRGLAYYGLSAEVKAFMHRGKIYNTKEIENLACEDWVVGSSIETENKIKFSDGKYSNFAFYSEFCYKNE